MTGGLTISVDLNLQKRPVICIGAVRSKGALNSLLAQLSSIKPACDSQLLLKPCPLPNTSKHTHTTDPHFPSKNHS